MAVPTRALDRLGAFEGFVADRRYFAALREATFLERDAAERDEGYRQIIPYVVLRAPAGIFSYARTSRGREARLHGLRSIGVGGHVNPGDLPDGLAALRLGAPGRDGAPACGQPGTTATPGAVPPESIATPALAAAQALAEDRPASPAALIAAARRELAEEVVGLGESQLDWLGFIREDTTPVARVHLGVVLAARLAAPTARLSDEGAMADARYLTIAALAADRDAYEGWSRLVIDHLAGTTAP